MTSKSNFSFAVRLLLCAGVALVLAFVLQLVPFSFRRTFIGGSVFTGPEMSLLEILIGFLDSTIVTTVVLLSLRRPMRWLVAVAVVVQIGLVETSYGFRQGGERLFELMIRYSEDFGVIAGGLFAIYLANRIVATRSAKSPSG